jgi:hypothetical protein
MKTFPWTHSQPLSLGPHDLLVRQLKWASSRRWTTREGLTTCTRKGTPIPHFGKRNFMRIFVFGSSSMRIGTSLSSLAKSTWPLRWSLSSGTILGHSTFQRSMKLLTFVMPRDWPLSWDLTMIGLKIHCSILCQSLCPAWDKDLPLDFARQAPLRLLWKIFSNTWLWWGGSRLS